MTFTISRTVCLKCGKPLERLTGLYETDWTHRTAQGWPRVGCRAASYNHYAENHAYWDDNIPRAWNATPDTTKIETTTETMDTSYGDGK